MTLTGQFVGSLPWASPEQAEGRPDKIDVRTDVYALGVILYQILTGQFPYEVVGSMRDVLENILTAQPTRPSTLRRKINDEIETIILKCLAKQPPRRYQSAGELARDIRHYLVGEPIEAKGDSGWYVLKKTLRRYRAAAGIAASFVVVLTASTVALWLMYQQAETARSTAEKEAQKAIAVNDLLLGMLRSPRPNRSGEDVTVREVLDEAAANLEPGLKGQPEIEAAVRETLGLTYDQLGMYEPAEFHLRLAVDLRRRFLGDEHPDTLVSMRGLATVLHDARKLEDAEPLFKYVLETQRRVLGEEDGSTLYTMYRLGALHASKGDLSEAERLFHEALMINRRGSPDDVDAFGRYISIRLAQTLKVRGKLKEAQRIVRQSLEVCRRTVGAEHWHTLFAMGVLGGLLLEQGGAAEAERVFRELLDLRRQVNGQEHPSTLVAKRGVAQARFDQGKLFEAESMLREVLRIQAEVLPPDHRQLLNTKHHLARVRQAMGEFNEAEALFKEVLESAAAAWPESHWRPALYEGRYGNCLKALGRYEEAEAYLLSGYEQLAAQFGEGHMRTQELIEDLIDLYVAWSQPDEAAEWRAKLPDEVNSNGQAD